MKEQMPIECEACGAKSDKTPIVTFAGHSKCWDCLTVSELSRLKNSLWTMNKGGMKRMEEGAQDCECLNAVRTVPHWVSRGGDNA